MNINEQAIRPLCIESARKTMNDSLLPAVSVEREETPRASPSVSPWTTKPRVRGNAALVRSDPVLPAGKLGVDGSTGCSCAEGEPASRSRSSSSASNSRDE